MGQDHDRSGGSQCSTPNEVLTPSALLKKSPNQTAFGTLKFTSAERCLLECSHHGVYERRVTIDISSSTRACMEACMRRQTSVSMHSLRDSALRANDHSDTKCGPVWILLYRNGSYSLFLAVTVPSSWLLQLVG